MRVGSGSLSPEDGFRLWCRFHYEYGVTIGDAAADEQLGEAFRAGYELARSQSTQGTGDWDPEE